MEVRGRRASCGLHTKDWHSTFTLSSRSGFHTGEQFTTGRLIELTCSMTEDFVIKYLWSACGYSLMSIPILFPAIKDVVNAASGDIHHDVASRTESERQALANDRALIPKATYQTDDCCFHWPTLGVD